MPAEPAFPCGDDNKTPAVVSVGSFAVVAERPRWGAQRRARRGARPSVAAERGGRARPSPEVAATGAMLAKLCETMLLYIL